MSPTTTPVPAKSWRNGKALAPAQPLHLPSAFIFSPGKNRRALIVGSLSQQGWSWGGGRHNQHELNTRQQRHMQRFTQNVLHPKYASLVLIDREFGADFTPTGAHGAGSCAWTAPDALKGAFGLPDPSPPGMDEPDGLRRLRRKQLPGEQPVFFCMVPLASTNPGSSRPSRSHCLWRNLRNVAVGAVLQSTSPAAAGSSTSDAQHRNQAPR